MTISITFIGAGRVAKTLGVLFQRNPALQILDILSRSTESAQRTATFIGAGSVAETFEQLRPASIFVLAVPDDQIAGCCAKLQQAGKLHRGVTVFHCSGALSSAELAAARATGAAVASVHPIRSFADPAAVADDFRGTWCGVEGDDAALAVLGPLFESFGARMVPVQRDAKTLYHAAAVFASNYVVTLMAVAQQAYIDAGIAPDVALALLAPLTRESVENVIRLGPAAALTGPIARGDHATVARQQQAVLEWDAGSGQLYAALANATRRLAQTRDQSVLSKPAII